MTATETVPTITIDIDAGTIRFGTKMPERATKHELLLLQLLIEHRGKPLSHQSILAALYDNHERPRPDTNTVKVFICKLRDRFERAGYSRRLICSSYGRTEKKGSGYWLES